MAAESHGDAPTLLSASTFQGSASKQEEMTGLGNEKMLPIHIVTLASQLPHSFLNPSPSNPIAVGFDCEGVDLCRTGRLCIMQIAFDDAVYLVDVISGEKDLMEKCKVGLESKFVTKVIHDCKRDGEALYFQFGIKLNPVFDTQIAYAMIEEKNGGKIYPHGLISFVQLLADKNYCGVLYNEKQEVKDIMQKDKEFWVHRPWTEMMKRVAADDVRFLPSIHRQMLSKLTKRELVLLALRSSLHCRCFCIDTSEWPEPFPSSSDIELSDMGCSESNASKNTPRVEGLNGNENKLSNALENEIGVQFENLKPVKKDDNGDNNHVNSNETTAETENEEDEILFIVDVPPDMMGRIIGKKGATINSIKMQSKVDIITGGNKGPPNKVFLIGKSREVQKTAAIIRGKIY